MRFRYTVNELQKPEAKEYLSDMALIVAILNERQGDCTNTNAPLYQRLKQLKAKAETLINNGKTNLSNL